MPRSSSLESSAIPWRYGLLPSHVGSQENPARTVAIFTVHGIGNQRHAETANAMRIGFERAMDSAQLQEQCGVPYVHDGFWGNYDNFEASMPELAATLTEEERESYQELFRARSLSGFRTFLWFGGRLMRMVSLRTLFKVGPIRYCTYVLMGVMSIVGMALLLVRAPRIMSTVVNDVRLYAGPEGDTERAICENIDRRIITQFLRLFGLSSTFEDLPDNEKLHLEGKPVVFNTVVWVSHSLGTVISYNALVDVIAACRTCVNGGAKPNATESERHRARNAHRVIGGLHRFITMGSPLQKATFLFEEALREAHISAETLQWLFDYRAQHKMSVDEWWMNYYLVMDPVSGRLLHNTRFAPFIKNIHPARVGIPAACHTAYWLDVLVTSPIISRALGRAVFYYDWQRAMWTENTVQWVRMLAFSLVVGMFAALCYGLFFWVSH